MVGMSIATTPSIFGCFRFSQNWFMTLADVGKSIHQLLSWKEKWL